jgi:hypothetical protein
MSGRTTARLVRYTTAPVSGGLGPCLSVPPAQRALPDGVVPYGYLGDGIISGVVKVNTTPVARKVRLHDMLTGLVVRETWSDASGAYQFERLAIMEYYVTAFDHLVQYNAVVADRIVPVLP